MKTLYITDLDGTLLNAQSRVSEKSLEILNALLDKGLPLTFATARSLGPALKATAGLHLRLPAITNNGAFIRDPVSGAFISGHYFSPEDTAFIRETLAGCDLHPLVFAIIEDKERVTRLAGSENDGVREYLASRPGDKRFRVTEDADAHFEGKIYYFTCIGSREELAPAYEKLTQRGVSCLLHPELRSVHWWLEILPPHSSKAEAIGELKHLLNFDKIVSFGDAVNDLTMFAVSDECYAVGNAVEEVKIKATDVIGDSEADGVALYLQANWRPEA